MTEISEGQRARESDDRPLWLFAAALCAFVIFWHLGLHDVTNVNEGLRLLPAAEMVEGGDWIVPRIEGRPYISKPPLIYWIIAASYELSGRTTPLAGRLPVALISFGAVLGVAWIGWRQGAGRTGLWSALLLATAYYYGHKAQMADIDPVLTAVILGGIYLYWSAVKDAAWRWPAESLAAGVFFGLALLLKGPVLFPFLLAAVAASWFVDRPRPSRIASVLVLSIAVGLLIFLPWGVALIRRLGWTKVWESLSEQSISRLASASRINSGPIYYYVVHVGAGFLPWTWLLCFWASRRFRAFCRREFSSFFRFAGLFALLSLAIFSLIAGKETEYLLPVFPFLAIACGPVMEWLTRCDSETTAPARWGAAIFCAIAVAGCLAPAVLFTRFATWLVGWSAGVPLLFLNAAIALVCLVLILKRRLCAGAILLVLVVAMLTVSSFDARKIRRNMKSSVRSAALLAAALGKQGVPVYRYHTPHCQQIWYLRKISRPVSTLDALTEESANAARFAVVTKRESVPGLTARLSRQFTVSKMLCKDSYDYAVLDMSRRTPGVPPVATPTR